MDGCWSGTARPLPAPGRSWRPALVLPAFQQGLPLARRRLAPLPVPLAWLPALVPVWLPPPFSARPAWPLPAPPWLLPALALALPRERPPAWRP